MVWRVERAGGLSVIQFLKEGMDDLASLESPGHSLMQWQRSGGGEDDFY